MSEKIEILLVDGGESSPNNPGDSGTPPQPRPQPNPQAGPQPGLPASGPSAPLPGNQSPARSPTSQHPVDAPKQRDFFDLRESILQLAKRMAPREWAHALESLWPKWLTAKIGGGNPAVAPGQTPQLPTAEVVPGTPNHPDFIGPKELPKPGEHDFIGPVRKTTTPETSPYFVGPTRPPVIGEGHKEFIGPARPPESSPTTLLGRLADTLAKAFGRVEDRISKTVTSVQTHGAELWRRTRRAGRHANIRAGEMIRKVQASKAYQQASGTVKRVVGGVRKAGSEVFRAIGRTKTGAAIGRGVTWAGTKAAGVASGIAARVGIGGGAAGGAAAGGVIAGLAGLAAPIAVVVSVLTAMATAGALLLANWKRQANELERFSSAIAGARIRAEARHTQLKIERARAIEHPVASVEKARSEFNQAMFELGTEIQKELAKLAPIAKAGIGLVTAGIRGVETIMNILQSVHATLKWNATLAGEEAKEALVSQGKMVKALKEAFEEESDDPTNESDKAILNANPFAPVAPQQANPEPAPIR